MHAGGFLVWFDQGAGEKRSLWRRSLQRPGGDLGDAVYLFTGAATALGVSNS